MLCTSYRCSFSICRLNFMKTAWIHAIKIQQKVLLFKFKALFSSDFELSLGCDRCLEGTTMHNLMLLTMVVYCVRFCATKCRMFGFWDAHFPFIRVFESRDGRYYLLLAVASLPVARQLSESLKSIRWSSPQGFSSVCWVRFTKFSCPSVQGNYVQFDISEARKREIRG